MLPCCQKMKKELFKGDVVSLLIQPEYQGEVEDNFEPVIEIPCGEEGGTQKIDFCPWCGKKIEIKTEPTKRKF